MCTDAEEENGVKEEELGGRETKGWPWPVGRWMRPEVPLFRRYANVARCDITDDVKLGCKYIL